MFVVCVANDQALSIHLVKEYIMGVVGPEKTSSDVKLTRPGQVIATFM